MAEAISDRKKRNLTYGNVSGNPMTPPRNSKDRVQGGAESGAVTNPKRTPVTPPKVNVPTITPPTMDTTQGQLGGVGRVQAPTVIPTTPVEAQKAKAGTITAKAGTAKEAKEPEQVTAATYDPTKVDPLAAQGKAAQTTYDPTVETAQAQTPQEALVSEQMKELTAGLESGNIPLWARGASEAVDAQLAARGLSRSSIGSADLTNAILQSALPIAQQNAQAVQQTSLQNLQNRQTANNLQAQLKTNVELANLSNTQQMALANQASKQAIMLSNQSAENASRQFNAQSQNQINTFMANLRSQTEQFNVAQANSMSQFNIAQSNAANAANVQLQAQTGQFNTAQVNGMAQFNSQLSTDLKKYNASQQMQADVFNKQNQLAVAQSNVQWRRQVSTANTQMQHEANMQTAANKFQLGRDELANYWQNARDTANWAWQSSENAESRKVQLIINSQNNKAAADAAKLQSNAAKEAGWANAIGAITGSVVSGAFNYFGD